MQLRETQSHCHCLGEQVRLLVNQLLKHQAQCQVSWSVSRFDDAACMFQCWMGPKLGCEAQPIRVGETDSGHFRAARRELCMMADSGSHCGAEGNEGGRFRMWCCLKRPPCFAVNWGGNAERMP